MIAIRINKTMVDSETISTALPRENHKKFISPKFFSLCWWNYARPFIRPPTLFITMLGRDQNSPGTTQLRHQEETKKNSQIYRTEILNKAIFQFLIVKDYFLCKDAHTIMSKKKSMYLDSNSWILHLPKDST